MILGAITGIGGGMLRDVLVGEIPTVLRGGLYALPAEVGAGVVVVAYHAGDHTIVFPIVGATVCFLMRMAGLRYGIGLPAAANVAVTSLPRLRRGHARDDDADDEQSPEPADGYTGEQSSATSPNR